MVLPVPTGALLGQLSYGRWASPVVPLNPSCGSAALPKQQGCPRPCYGAGVTFGDSTALVALNI